MLYKFKSQATGDVIMLEANGDQLLSIIGKQASLKGIITVDQMPAAIASIEAAVKSYADDLDKEPGHLGTELGDISDYVQLGVRATPFIEMLRSCTKAKKDIVWGV